MTALPAGAATGLTAVTAISNHADSGTHGDNWATENYRFAVSVQRTGGAVATSNCTSGSPVQPGTPSQGKPTDTGSCYQWTATETFSNGTFTTVPGTASPRKGITNDLAVSGPFSGWVHNIVFYSSWKGVYAAQSRVPSHYNNGGTKGTGVHAVTGWPALFFGPQATVNVAKFGDSTVSTYWFSYTLPFKSNSECPRVASKWVDSVPWTNDGAAASAGDILAPSAAHGC